MKREMASILQSWPEPIVRVQSLSESGITKIPERYIKKPSERPTNNDEQPENNILTEIPVIDLAPLLSTDKLSAQTETLAQISAACRDWGFIQVINHGVDHDLILKNSQVWREFFHSPVEEKLKYASTPVTYEGYCSRLGVEKEAILDWCDFYFLHYRPFHVKDVNKWPSTPISCRETIDKYGEEMIKLCRKLLKVLSLNLDLEEGYLNKAFGGEEVGANQRVNYYPKCPQPELTLGLSPHSDPGGLTVLYPDQFVAGLQVRRGENSWVTIKPLPNAFIVNIGDQIQVLSNGVYKSVEHRVIVNQAHERLSIAFFYNPRSDLLIQPASELVTPGQRPLYPAMTFDEYRLFIRARGLHGKSQVESLITAATAATTTTSE